MFVTLFKNQMIGCMLRDTNFIGLATIRAILSACNKPIRLGISSPKMMDRRVTIITTSVIEIVAA
jgi:hypothetical protein